MIKLPTGLGVAGKLPSRSAFSTPLWLCAVVSSTATTGAVLNKEWVAVWLLILMTIIDLGTFLLFVFHSIKNRDMTYSEDFLLRRGALEIYGSSSSPNSNVAKIVMEGVSNSKRRSTGDES